MSNKNIYVAYWGLLGIACGVSYQAHFYMPIFVLAAGEALLLSKSLRSRVIAFVLSLIAGVLALVLLVLLSVPLVVSGVSWFGGEGGIDRLLIMGFPVHPPWLCFTAIATAQYICFTQEGSENLKYWVPINTAVAFVLSWATYKLQTVLNVRPSEISEAASLINIGFYFVLCTVLGLCQRFGPMATKRQLNADGGS